MADKVIFAEQTVEFAVAEFPDGTFYHVTLFDDFVPLTLGATYRVIWGDDEYICIATDMDGMAGIGNVTILQTIGLDMPGTDTGEPFVIAVDTGAVVIYTLDPSTTSRIVAIYEVAAEDKQYLIYGSTLTGIAKAIRSKTESTEPIAITDMAAQIAGISGGSGSVEGVHFVTFMSDDGAIELYKRPVADGDDCADPVARGLMDAPAKESTVQYDFSFLGWATQANGAWDENALNAVTANKTVYAAYASVLRYYTITYYDSDGTTVLKTESLAYGSTPAYTPGKDGASFTGWEPALAIVTGNASYTAQWQEKITFAGGSWADIAAISESGKASEYFSVGDERVISYFGDSLTLQIAGFNHDDLADGSGKAGMTIICKNLPSFTLTWDGSARYELSTIPSKMDGVCKAYLPSDLQSVLKQVNKPVDGTYNMGANAAVNTLSCYLFPLSLDEMNADLSIITSASNPRESYSVLGTPYALFPTSQGRGSFYRQVGTSGTYGNWFTRQINRVGIARLVYGKTDGGLSSSNSVTLYPHFGFCI